MLMGRMIVMARSNPGGWCSSLRGHGSAGRVRVVCVCLDMHSSPFNSQPLHVSSRLNSICHVMMDSLWKSLSRQKSHIMNPIFLSSPPPLRLPNLLTTAPLPRNSPNLINSPSHFVFLIASRCIKSISQTTTGPSKNVCDEIAHRQMILLKPRSCTVARTDFSLPLFP